MQYNAYNGMRDGQARIDMKGGFSNDVIGPLVPTLCISNFSGRSLHASITTHPPMSMRYSTGDIDDLPRFIANVKGGGSRERRRS